LITELKGSSPNRILKGSNLNFQNCCRRPDIYDPFCRQMNSISRLKKYLANICLALPTPIVTVEGDSCNSAFHWFLFNSHSCTLHYWSPCQFCDDIQSPSSCPPPVNSVTEYMRLWVQRFWGNIYLKFNQGTNTLYMNNFLGGAKSLNPLLCFLTNSF